MIVERIADTGKGITNLDKKYKGVVVIMNASNKAQKYVAKDLVKSTVVLHPVLKAGADARVKTSTFKKGTFTVPALTVAVFVQTK